MKRDKEGLVNAGSLFLSACFELISLRSFASLRMTMVGGMAFAAASRMTVGTDSKVLSPKSKAPNGNVEISIVINSDGGRQV